MNYIEKTTTSKGGIVFIVESCTNNIGDVVIFDDLEYTITDIIKHTNVVKFGVEIKYALYVREEKYTNAVNVLNGYRNMYYKEGGEQQKVALAIDYILPLQVNEQKLLSLYRRKATLLELLYVCTDDQQINISQMKEKAENFSELAQILEDIEKMEATIRKMRR